MQAIIDDPIQNYPPATVACFDPMRGSLPRRELDHDLLGRFLARLDRAGADGLLIGASTGQGHLRSGEELSDWFKAAGEANLERAILMGLVRPEDGEAQLHAHAQIMAEAGYRVGFVRPGSGMGSSADAAEIAENMMPAVRALAEAGLAVGLYSIPDVSGIAMPVDSVKAILESNHGDRIVAVKVTESDYEQSTQRFLNEPMLARIKIVQGWDPHLARALRDGGRQVGVTSGPMSFAVYQYVHLLEQAAAGEWDEVARAQAAVTQVFVSMQDDPKLFADLQRAKAIMGLGHPITGTVSEEQIERVFASLQEVERVDDRRRLSRSLDLMEEGPFHDALQALVGSA